MDENFRKPLKPFRLPAEKPWEKRASLKPFKAYRIGQGNKKLEIVETAGPFGKRRLMRRLPKE